MPLVVDASVALAWAFPDESSGYADSVLAIVEQEGLLVPEPWIREVANGLAMAHRRKRITSADEQAFLFALSHLKIDVEASIGASISLIRWSRESTSIHSSGAIVRITSNGSLRASRSHPARGNGPAQGGHAVPASLFLGHGDCSEKVPISD